MVGLLPLFVGVYVSWLSRNMPFGWFTHIICWVYVSWLSRDMPFNWFTPIVCGVYVS